MMGANWDAYNVIYHNDPNEEIIYKINSSRTHSDSKTNLPQIAHFSNLLLKFLNFAH